MATITSLGSGSGLDLEGILTKLMTVEQLPLTQLQSQQTSYQTKLSAWGTVQSTLSALQVSAQTLSTGTTFTGASASVTDASVLSASASSGAALGSYSISVGQLAQAQVLRSNTNFANTTDTFNTGSIAISVAGATATNITIDSTNNTLAGISAAINAAGAGVTASVVNDGTTNRLLISSNTTGLTAGAVNVAVTDSGSGGTNALSTLDGSSLVQVQAPLDAQLSVNGLSVTRANNTVSDIITGVTLNLTKAGTLASPITTQLNVSPDINSVQSAVSTFISSYNAVVSQFSTLTAYDTTNKTSSVLTGDGTLRTIQSQLSRLLNGTVSGLSGNISSLADIGISVQLDGTLSLDSAKLTAALNTNANSVSSLFSSTSTNNQGLAVQINSALNNFISTNGLIASSEDSINQSIKDNTNQQAALNLQLTAIEANYRAQFTALDTAVADMQSTSSFLTQQLSILQSLVTGVSSSSSSKVG